MQKRFVKIKSIEEPIGRCILEDGTVITFRLAVGAAYRLYEDDGKTPCTHPEGGAMHGLATQTLINIVQEPNDIQLTDWREPPKDKAN